MWSLEVLIGCLRDSIMSIGSFDRVFEANIVGVEEVLIGCLRTTLTTDGSFDRVFEDMCPSYRKF